MAILVLCPCGRQFVTKDANAGRSASCDWCGGALTVPDTPDTGPGESLAIGAVRAPWSGRAIGSVVLGGLSLVLVLFAGIPAVILGGLAIGDIRKSRGRLRGLEIAILGILLGLIGSTAGSFLAVTQLFTDALERQRNAECVDNLRRIGLAMHNYAAAHRAFPAAAITDKQGRPLLSWRVAILPYLGPEGAELYAKFRLNEPWNSPNNAPLANQMPAVYACPSGQAGGYYSGLTSYQVMVGPRTVFPGLTGVAIAEITDGTSNTVLVGESDTTVLWTTPQDLAFDPAVPAGGFGSFHESMFHLLFADGTVHEVSTDINTGLLKSLLSRDGGEVVKIP